MNDSEMTDVNLDNDNTTNTDDAANLRRKSTSQGETLYEQLGVSKDATADEIKKSYRKQALKYHPDRNPDDPQAADKMRALNYAHSVLSDERKKEIYDKYGTTGLTFFEQMGEDEFMMYLALAPWYAKAAFICCGIITGCYFCCFCFFCCCNGCCGACSLKENAENADENITSTQPEPMAMPNGGGAMPMPPPEGAAIPMPPPEGAAIPMPPPGDAAIPMPPPGDAAIPMQPPEGTDVVKPSPDDNITTMDNQET